MRRLAKTVRISPLALALGGVLLAEGGVARANDAMYEFDDRLLMGSSLSTGNLQRFNRGDQVDAGRYVVDVYLNDAYVDRRELEFKEMGGGIQPCLDETFLQDTLGARLHAVGPAEGAESACSELKSRLPGASSALDVARLRLDISVPQVLLISKPRDHVSRDMWDAGKAMAFANYDLNASRSSAHGMESHYASAAVNAGANLGMWRLRHQSNLTYSSRAGQQRSDWNSIRTYAQRSLPGISSEMTIGSSYTEGNLFGNLSYRGIKIASDERMIPDSQRRYAPVIRGTATSKSRVVISQNGRKLREDTMPPGPFVIDDISGAAYGGDLDVEVHGADGSVGRFSVPFSAVPESVRPGYSKYSATVGEAGASSQSKQGFAEFTYQRGLSNRLTINTGARIAENYVGVLAGGVVSTPYGAFGGNSVFSSLYEKGAGAKTGYRLELNYSKTFQATDTTFTLAGYRYSSSGFRDFSDALGQPWQQDAFEDDVWQPERQRNQRNQFSVVMNQRLGDYGSLYLTGSAADYFNDSQRDVQFQFGYSNTWRRLSYSLSLSQQRNCTLERWDFRSTPQCQVGRSLGLTVSMPLGRSPSAPVLSGMATRDTGAGGSSYQSVVSGSLGERRTTNYAVSAGQGGSARSPQWSGNLQTQTAMGSFSAGVSGGSAGQQLTAGMRGALVLHGEGLTFGPYLGDSFALVKAEGAQGSLVRGGQGARVNRNGFALMPSLSPYRVNRIGLDPQDMTADAELVETERTVVPSAGAALHVVFETLTGTPLIVRARLADGNVVPLGASVADEMGATIGMVGQAGLIYARAAKRTGLLSVQWSETANGSCSVAYDLGAQAPGSNAAPVIIEATCQDMYNYQVGAQ